MKCVVMINLQEKKKKKRLVIVQGWGCERRLIVNVNNEYFRVMEIL